MAVTTIVSINLSDSSERDGSTPPNGSAADVLDAGEAVRLFGSARDDDGDNNVDADASGVGGSSTTTTSDRVVAGVVVPLVNAAGGSDDGDVGATVLSEPVLVSEQVSCCCCCFCSCDWSQPDCSW